MFFRKKREKGITKTMDKETKKEYDLLKEIVNRKKEEKDYSDLKEKVMELSNEWNKDLLFEDFVSKVNVFFSYDEDETEVFPLQPWVDSFFEN